MAGRAGLARKEVGWGLKAGGPGGRGLGLSRVVCSAEPGRATASDCVHNRRQFSSEETQDLCHPQTADCSGT